MRKCHPSSSSKTPKRNKGEEEGKREGRKEGLGRGGANLMTTNVFFALLSCHIERWRNRRKYCFFQEWKIDFPQDRMKFTPLLVMQ